MSCFIINYTAKEIVRIRSENSMSTACIVKKWMEPRWNPKDNVVFQKGLYLRASDRTLFADFNIMNSLNIKDLHCTCT